jgi:hypothetical protein
MLINLLNYYSLFIIAILLFLLFIVLIKFILQEDPLIKITNFLSIFILVISITFCILMVKQDLNFYKIVIIIIFDYILIFITGFNIVNSILCVE